ncbi:MAG: ribonuclease P protein component [Bacteroidales bacterium]
MRKYGLGKDERIHGKALIDRIFRDGTPIYHYPIKAVVLKSEENNRVSNILVSAQKRQFKKAVDRNLLKRRIKEAYRLNKGLLSKCPNSTWHIALLYSSKKIESYKQIDKAIKVILNTINKKES